MKKDIHKLFSIASYYGPLYKDEEPASMTRSTGFNKPCRKGFYCRTRKAVTP